MRYDLLEEFMEALVDALGIDRLRKPSRSREQDLSQLDSRSHSAVGHRMTVAELSASCLTTARDERRRSGLLRPTGAESAGKAPDRPPPPAAGTGPNPAGGTFPKAGPGERPVLAEGVHDPLKPSTLASNWPARRLGKTFKPAPQRG